ncbi:16S rRNA (cytosine(967)-C(5))-methyltransferase RsmB [Alkalicoccobacillus porphyridii]|uniref:16S rRNA (cytosine(967)-C(5))-methyltransferase n=1 Tax=Alkalicoccobacillus porphyridii TaxID=2597270 RepID=A0A553ZY37_9BACI|nr:16S rRNA (cytosine(967)-C(5))-methyltransferase RsmB [Alkalicoccobacillus porphyridii]TSB46361.1 16S rRNA (cytosine(967)-C(5))-methyltransferase RsmB [Alkalicoccobacillus porphyridii]
MGITVREAALDVLLKIEKNQAYSHLLLNETRKSAGLDRRDSALLTEIVYGTIQRKLTLDYYMKPFLKKGSKKLDTWVLVLLRLSMYQMIYLDRVPERAIVHEAVTIANKRGHKGISGMVNGVLRAFQRAQRPAFEQIENPLERLSISTSHPEWLLKRWIEQYGEHEVEKMCAENLLPASLSMRINTTKTNREDLLRELEEEGIEARAAELSEVGIVIEKGAVFESKAYLQGKMTAQDESSMLVAQALAPEAGMEILDTCAAPGGKTTHLAELMNNQGSVQAFDLHTQKIKLIKDQAHRLGLSIIKAEAMDARKLVHHQPVYDRVLVDAPCTGFGVLKRKPDIKWAKSEQDVKQIAKVQADILAAASTCVKKGGRLVYSTCTVDKAENEGTVQQFLRNHPDFVLDEQLSNRLPFEPEANRYQTGMLTVLPQDYQSDGFFIAALLKK